MMGASDAADARMQEDNPKRSPLVMTAKEVSEVLQIPKYTVYELAKRGELPSVRLGRRVLFSRKKIEGLFE